MMCKMLNKYIAEFDNIDQTLLILPVASGVISITSFANMIDAHFGIRTARVSLVFFGKGIVKRFLKNNKETDK